MTDSRLSQATLLLLGHGAQGNPGSTAPALAIANHVRERGLFAEVVTAFYRVPPFLADAIGTVRCQEVFAVPLTISEGYFTTEVIPSGLGLGSLAGQSLPIARRVGGRILRFCRPLGTHERLTDRLLYRAQEVLTRASTLPPPRPDSSALFIAGHGTTRNRRSREAIEDQVRRIAAMRIFAEVHPAFMMESPRIEDCWNATTQPDLILMPFFISDGLHTQEDIPVLLGAARETVLARLRHGEPSWINPTRRGRQRLWYGPALHTDPLLSELVLERVLEARALPPLPADA